MRGRQFVQASAIMLILLSLILLEACGQGGTTFDPGADHAASASSANLYLHGLGPTDNPSNLFLNKSAPLGSTAKYRDSRTGHSTGSNGWQEVGIWNANPALNSGDLIALQELHVWLGLTSEEDEAARFDLRAELRKNGQVIAAGERNRISGLKRDSRRAREVLLQLSAPDASFNGSTDTLSLKLLARESHSGRGGDEEDEGCNRGGLRVYFDSSTRPSRFGTTTNLPPTAVASASPTAGSAPLEVELSPAGSSDPDGSIVEWEWDMLGDGNFQDFTGSSGTASYNYTVAGTYHPVLRVTDDSGASSSAGLTITVSNGDGGGSTSEDICFRAKSGGVWGIWVMNSDGSGLRKLCDTGGMPTLRCAWSPDKNRIVFDNSFDGGYHFQIYVVNADGTNIQQVTNDPGTANAPCWDGNDHILYEANASPDTGEIFRIKVDGTENQVFSTPGDGIYSGAPWVYDDGHKITFGERPAGGGLWKVYVADYPSMGNKQLAGSTGQIDILPSARNTQKVYWFTWWGFPEYYIYSANQDGSDVLQLSPPGAQDSLPIAAPDDSLVYFVSNSGGTTNLWRMGPDGSNRTQVTNFEAVGPGDWYTPPAPSGWVHSWGGNEHDALYAVASGPDGSVYASGHTRVVDSGGWGNAFLTKYDSTGQIVFRKEWGVSGTYDFGYCLGVSPGGDVFVAGGGLNIMEDAFVMKFDSAGSLLWQKKWGTAGSDICEGITFAQDGNPVLTGWASYGPGSVKDAFLLKLDQSGSVVFHKVWGGANRDQPDAVTMDASGNFLVVGTTDASDGDASSGNAMLMKFNSAGASIWQRSWSNGSYSEFYDAGSDAAGKFYCCGRTTANGNDLLLLKLDSFGNLEWQRQWGGSGEESYAIPVYGRCTGLQVKPLGGCCVGTVTSSAGAGGCDGALLELSSAGTLNQQRAWGSAGVQGFSGLSLNQNSYCFSGLAANNSGSWQAISLPFTDPGGSLVPLSFTVMDASIALSDAGFNVNDLAGGVSDTGGGDTDGLVMKWTF